MALRDCVVILMMLMLVDSRRSNTDTDLSLHFAILVVDKLAVI